MRDEVTLQLEVTRIRTRKPSGWGVAAGKTLSNNESVTVVGIGVGSLSQGDRIECTGAWSSHPTFGAQFQLSNIKELDDPVNHHLIYWLRSFKGIGPAKGAELEAIYRETGYEAMFSRLTSIIGSQRTPDIAAINWATWLKPVLDRMIKRSKSYGPRGLSCFLSLAKSLHKRSGGALLAKDIVEQVNTLWDKDPYDVLSAYYGFKEADIFILKNNVVKPDADVRIGHVINHLMMNEPDTIHELHKIHARANDEFAVPVWDMVMDGSLTDKTDVLLFERGGETYLQNEMLNQCEHDIKDRVEALADRQKTGLVFQPEDLAKALPFKLTNEQMVAVQKLVDEPMGVLTGGAGTGKTTLMRAMLKAYRCAGSGVNFRLAAPTNKAARRLAKQTGVHATSIHKLLQAEPFDTSDRDRKKRTGLTFNFAVNENNPIRDSLIIVDEMSMVDTRIMAALLRGIDPETCNLLMVGDHEQLAPVQEGQPFVDIMEANSLPVVNTIKLDRIMRQNPGQLLNNASAIRVRKKDLVRMTRAPDWEFISADDDEAIRKVVIANARKLYHDSGRDPMSFQIITPRRHGHALSTLELNKAFRLEEFNTPNYTFVPGDKGLCTGHNAYGLINGDVFKVESVESATNEMVISFDTVDGLETKKVPRDHPTFTQGWAITIHKFQGDEAPFIVLPISKTFGTFLSRSMLYTAITRAQKKVILVGDYSAFMDALDNEEPSRLTGFKIGVLDAA